MDGSNAAFLLEPSFLSSREPLSRTGILYVEDFGAAEAASGQDHAPAEHTYTAADLKEARQAGLEEGAQAALADALLMQTQLHAAVLQSLTDGLAASRETLDTIADAHGGALSRTVLGVLQAALPATMRTHSAAEMQAMLHALLRGLACEPTLRVRVHPGHADMVRETLVALLPADTCVLSVCADGALAWGDVRIAWQDGHARRDTAAIWEQIRAALHALALPTLQELCHDT